MPLSQNHYSEETQSILGQTPSWILSWGITIIFGILIVIMLGCYFIKYPDTIQTSIVITTENPPANVIAKQDGLIDCLCCNKSEFKDIQILIALIVVIIAVFLLIGFISAILRIHNITHKIRFINSTIMRMECCSDDSKKIELEINRLTQELNADSSRDIWKAIFNSR